MNIEIPQMPSMYGNISIPDIDINRELGIQNDLSDWGRNQSFDQN